MYLNEIKVRTNQFWVSGLSLRLLGHEGAYACMSLHMQPYPETQHTTPIKT